MKFLFQTSSLLILFLTLCNEALGQIEVDTTKTDQINIDHSDEATGETVEGEEEVRTLLGNVALRQKNVFMYCDSAVIKNNNVDAVGNIIIQQGDSISVFSDSLSYEGDSKIAHLYYDVALQKDSQKLFTDDLIYDLNIKRGVYYNWAILTNDTTQLRSKRGYFYVDRDEAFFKDSVTIVDPDFELKTDTLKYNTKTGVATFLAPTLINQGDGKIYCEGGYYDTKNKEAHFIGNAQYIEGEEEASADHIHYDGNAKTITLIGNANFKKDSTIAYADTIIYEENSKLTYLLGNAHVDGDQIINSNRIVYNSETESFETDGRARIIDGPQILDADHIVSESETAIASGNVIWIDTIEQVSIECEHLNYNKETEHIIASGGRPLLISLVDDDTMYMSSDTLVSFRREHLIGTDTLTGIQEFETDSMRTMIAYPDVRILKSNLQAIADSVSYVATDSIFEFYKDPIIWSDTSQFTADTMYMQLANDKIDRIFLRKKAMIINSPDEVYFNQIKGKNITAFFKENELRKMLVLGSAESIYYALDDVGAYVGLNQTVCSEMLMYFDNNTINDIRFYAQPKSNTFPMGQVNHIQKRLDGFSWDMDLRPATVEDLLRIKEKKHVVRDSSKMGLDSLGRTIGIDSLGIMGIDSLGGNLPDSLGGTQLKEKLEGAEGVKEIENELPENTINEKEVKKALRREKRKLSKKKKENKNLLPDEGG